MSGVAKGSVPTVSVMVPVFNAERSLRRAIASMLSQTFEDWECIIVDDGSTDGTWELLESLTDPRIKRHRLSKNRGRGWARAEALERVTGCYLGMVDADDWLYPEKLSVQVARMEASPTAGYVSAAAAICDASGEMIGRQGPAQDVEVPPAHRLEHARFVHASTIFRTAAVRKFGYDRNLRFCEDKDLLVQLTRSYGGTLLAQPLYVYAQPGSMSFEKMSSSYEAHLAIWAKHRRTDPMRSTVLSVEALAKREIYRAAYTLGLGDKLVERRWSTPSQEELRSYERARAVVAAWEKSLDSSPAPR